MQYELVFIECEKQSGDIRICQMIRKLHICYPRLSIRRMVYGDDPTINEVMEQPRIATVILRDENHILCHIKAETPFEFFKLWLEEKIMEDGGTLDFLM